MDRLCDTLHQGIGGFPKLKGVKPYEAQLKAVVEELLDRVGLTWRYLILCLDDAEETDAADTLKDFAEPLIGR